MFWPVQALPIEQVAAIPRETLILFHELSGEFNDNILREILLASIGVKVSRTCMSIAELETFVPTAQDNNLKVVISAEKYIHRQDIGKGGWSNSLERSVSIDHPDGLFNVYIASDKQLAEKSLKLEEFSEQDDFGSLLGIPRCCRDAYLRSQPIAKLKQNDFVPLVLENTKEQPPYNFWNNYVAQYFGRALLSFFPCSFNCPEAAKLAQTTFNLLRQCSESWAYGFIKLQKTNILYTEYDGLHLFQEPIRINKLTPYDKSKVQSTEYSEIREKIKVGNQIKVLGKRCIEIYNNRKLISRIEGEDVSMCIFNC